MYREVNKKIKECIRNRNNYNKIEFDNKNFKEVTETREKLNKKVEFDMNLRKAISKK